MPIGRGGGASLAEGETEGDGLVLAPETAPPEAPAPENGDAGEVLPVTTLTDGWAFG